MDGESLLVVERDPQHRRTLLEVLAAAGREVAGAASAEEAVLLLGQRPFDVLVLGHRPPSDATLPFLPLAAAKAPGLSMVVLSSSTCVNDGVEAMKLGAIDFLVFPCSPEALEASVTRAVRAARTRRSIAAPGGRRELLIGRSPAMQQVRDTIQRLAGSDTTTVLIEGETGTGKEVVAQAIQACSARCGRPFLRLNCAALPDTLFEAELFGHEKGAFTTAHAQRPGIFEAAARGTVLLDEMGELPPSVQAKLLRFLENRTYRRVGGVEERTADVRILASTHVNLEEQAAAGRFRPDLFFRLNVVRVRLPPLRERPEDVPMLAATFVVEFNERLGRSVLGIAPEALEALERHPWPGNVRELRNVIERAFIMSPRMAELRPEHLPAQLSRGRQRRPAVEAGTGDLALCATEHRLLREAILRTGGNQTHAAKMLGITRFTLRYRLRKYGLAPPAHLGGADCSPEPAAP